MITHRQKECLELIASAEICPSYDEIAYSLGLKSKSGVARIVNGLEERGMINRIPDRTRAIEVTAKGKALLSGGELETVFKYDVDDLMHGLRADLFMLKCAVRHDDPKGEIIVRIEDIEKFIKEKWIEK